MSDRLYSRLQPAYQNKTAYARTSQLLVESSHWQKWPPCTTPSSTVYYRARRRSEIDDPHDDHRPSTINGMSKSVNKWPSYGILLILAKMAAAAILFPSSTSDFKIFMLNMLICICGSNFINITTTTTTDHTWLITRRSQTLPPLSPRPSGARTKGRF